MNKINNILVIGTGNVGSHLAIELKKNIKNLFIYGRNKEELNQLEVNHGLKSISSLNNLSKKVELILVAVNDNSVSDVIMQLPKGIPIAYTSGSVKLNDIKRANTGVFYPLQTFTKNKSLYLANVPFLIEANSKELEQKLIDLAKLITAEVHLADSDKRAHLHLAAVFANNFTNHMYHLSASYLKQNNLSFDLLIPLIQETTEKIKTLPPEKAQTGPAHRKDYETMKTHEKKLTGSSLEIYKIISASILNLNSEK